MLSGNNIDTLIFDLDGTLADTLPDLATSVNYALAKEGFKVNQEQEYRSFLGNGSKVLIKKALKDYASEENIIKVYDIYMDYYLSHVAVKTKPFKGMKETLTILKSLGFNLFCLTNKPQDAARELNQKLFGNLLTYTLGNSKDIPTKPDPYGVNLLIDKFHLKKERIAYFGDSDVDMILADKAGLSVKVACLYGYRPVKELLEAKPNYVLEKPEDILLLPFVKERL